ncbi:oligosaccharide flippase family protein [uncultured Bacteroides sp.]|uniref:oligosaccharide flippase family protein n=1 Tax=uncultured Bacteroides sp. TaxID=162156 RepID=UPI0026051082|nr:oligosaccharide flippase family protein [uncultured Bacteroides sp.]
MSQPSVKKNYIYRTLYEILVLITPFITTPYVSRVLGADGVGIYSYTSSIITYFTLFAAIGTASYGAREIAQHRDDRQQSSKLFWEIELMTVGTTAICLIAWCAVILFSKQYRLYFIALTPVLLGTMFDISWYFTGLERIKNIVICNSFCRIAGIILLFAFVKQREDLVLYVVINSMVTMLGNLSMWIYLLKMLAKVDIRTLTFKKHFKETLIYFVPTIATSIYTVLDKTLIGAITHDTYQNGYYEQANKIMRMTYTVSFVAINSVMSARISYLFAEKKYGEIKNRIRKTMDFIFLIGFGCTFGVIGVAGRFVPAFFGSGYEPVVNLLYYMSPLIIIVGVSNCLGANYFTPSGQRARSARVIVLGSVVNMILNLSLIPFIGATGAVIASIIAEAVISVLYVHMSGEYMSGTILLKLSWKRILSGLIMLILVSILGKYLPYGNFVVSAIQVVAGVAIYFGLLLLMKDNMLRELIALGILKRGGKKDAAD